MSCFLAFSERASSSFLIFGMQVQDSSELIVNSYNYCN